MVKRRVLLAWSSGKDSAWTLHVLRNTQGLEVVGLLTTVNAAVARVAVHAVREELLERQAEATRLPLHKVPIPSPCSNEEYENAMSNAIGRAKDSGIDCIAFGDLGGSPHSLDRKSPALRWIAAAQK